MNNLNKIVLEHGQRKELAKIFGVSGAMVTFALKGKRKSDTANKIRHVAISQFGGEVVRLKKIAAKP